MNRYSVDPIGYDDNGNITGITRKGFISGSSYNTIDNLTYTYSATYGNMLTSIAEASDATRGFKTLGGAGYTYDNIRLRPDLTVRYYGGRGWQPEDGQLQGHYQYHLWHSHAFGITT